MLGILAVIKLWSILFFNYFELKITTKISFTSCIIMTSFSDLPVGAFWDWFLVFHFFGRAPGEEHLDQFRMREKTLTPFACKTISARSWICLSNFRVCGRNPIVFPFKRNVFSRTLHSSLHSLRFFSKRNLIYFRFFFSLAKRLNPGKKKKEKEKKLTVDPWKMAPYSKEKQITQNSVSVEKSCLCSSREHSYGKKIYRLVTTLTWSNAWGERDGISL